MVLQNICNNFDSIFLLTYTALLKDNNIDAVVLFGLKFMKNVVIYIVKNGRILGELKNERKGFNI